MQTFLPYEDFEQSLRSLDLRRLNKQRIEAYQVLRAIAHQSKGWRNHPTVLLWTNHESWLVDYYNLSLKIWKETGYQNNMKPAKALTETPKPNWLGNQRFHQAHQAQLLLKNPAHYQQFNWQTPANLEYIWPYTNTQKNQPPCLNLILPPPLTKKKIPATKQ